MDLHLLRLALSHHIGQELTPEVASRIEFIAAGGVDLSPDTSKVMPVVVGDYRIQLERLSEILSEVHPLHELHWTETEKHRHGIALQPDYQAMLLRERSGRLLQFTVRAFDGQLVGHCRMYLGTSLHTCTLFAEEDTLFLLPQHRGGFLAIHLLRYVERVLVEQFHVREIRADSKLVNNADVLMRRLRYREVATKFVKVFPEKGGV